jgi:dGTP triphosphohydrolase
MTQHGQAIIHDLFDHLQEYPEKITHFDDTQNIETQICDFIAGMTDQFAEKFWEKEVRKK